MSDEFCRRAKLIEYFGEAVLFEEGRCGTCDNCKNIQIASELERDFGNEGARLVLYIISVLKEKSCRTTIEHMLSGKVIERYHYRSTMIDPMRAQEKIMKMKASCTNGKS